MLLTVDIEKKLGAFRLRSAFSVDRERFALLGASGCGKSMTLKCIAGIEKPDRGRITLGDRVLFDAEKKVNLPARERRVGYLFQNYALFPNMTVRKNVACAAKDPAYAEELLERFCITDVADQYPAELSGGQSQRTALARMLAAKPELLMLDEPFSALDNYMRTRMEHEILDIMKEFGGPVILVTHDRNEAYRLAGRIGVMADGQLTEVQDRQEFFDHPRTVAAARLTGCKNISRLTEREDGSFFAEDWGIPVASPAGESLAGVPYVGFRAHYFRWVEEAVPTDSGSGDASEGEAKVLSEGANEGVPVISCCLQRVIEDTFSVVVCFTAEGNPSESPDALLTWVVDKSKWDVVKERVLAGHFRLQIDPEKLILLEP